MKRVVIASDGSTGAEEAAWLLSHLPHRDKLHLTILTVLQIPAVYAHGAPNAMSGSVDRERQAAESAFKRIEAMFDGANVDIQHVMREGHRGKTIVQVAREDDADLIVVGARGHSKIRRLLLGSISDYVATHGHCSVLVVRPTGIREDKRAIRVAIGFEDSDPARASLQEFCETPLGGQSQVHLLSVVSYVSAFLNEIVVEADDTKAAALKALEQAAHQVASCAPNVQQHLIESDHIGEGIIEFIDEHGIDLVVVGESSHSAIGRVLLGSVSRFVLRHSPCSVWVTRNRAMTVEAADSGAQTEADP
ncbi:MAG: universal stress protein [Planctomycetota bacterium]